MVRVANVAKEFPGASERAIHANPSNLGIGTGKKARSRRGVLLVAGGQRSLRKLVDQTGACAHGPAPLANTAVWVGAVNGDVLRTGSNQKIQSSRDRAPVAQVDDVDIDLAASSQRKHEFLKRIDHCELIPPIEQVAVSGFDGELLAVDQLRVVIEEMGRAISARHCYCGPGRNTLHDVRDCQIRYSGRLSNRPKLSTAKAR